MISPMLASTMEKANITTWSDWAIEEKFDGHRVVVEVKSGAVVAWSRNLKIKSLAPHLVNGLSKMPDGIYDGELIAGNTSTDVTRLDLKHTLRFVVFDVLQLVDVGTCGLVYDQRRELLVKLFRSGYMKDNPAVELAESQVLTRQLDVTAFCQRVWKRGGEGAILKRRNAMYQAGRRSPDFVKVKKLLTAVVTVIGFEPSRGTVRFPGHPFAIVRVQDDERNVTTVKTKDDKELTRFEVQHKLNPKKHPALGKLLRIEYQDRTADGGYRHPRWDRWEDE